MCIFRSFPLLRFNANDIPNTVPYTPFHVTMSCGTSRLIRILSVSSTVASLDTASPRSKPTFPVHAVAMCSRADQQMCHHSSKERKQQDRVCRSSSSDTTCDTGTFEPNVRLLKVNATAVVITPKSGVGHTALEQRGCLLEVWAGRSRCGRAREWRWRWTTRGSAPEQSKADFSLLVSPS